MDFHAVFCAMAVFLESAVETGSLLRSFGIRRAPRFVFDEFRKGGADVGFQKVHLCSILGCSSEVVFEVTAAIGAVAFFLFVTLHRWRHVAALAEGDFVEVDGHHEDFLIHNDSRAKPKSGPAQAGPLGFSRMD